MSITQEQKQARLPYLGASEAPAVMGCDPYRSAADLWLIKTGRADSFDGNSATDRGNWLEPGLIAFAQSKLAGFETGVMRVHADGLRAANFDGLALDGTFVVEAKSAAYADPDEWGEDGSDVVPDRVNVQLAQQFDIAGPQCRVGYVPLIVPAYRRFEFRLYEVPRNDDLVRIVAEGGTVFMRDFVRADRQPADFRPSLEVLKRMRRQPNKCTTIPDEVLDAWIVTKAAVKQAEEDNKAAQAVLLAALGDCEQGIASKGAVTYIETHRKAYSVEATSFRQLRLKAAKGL